MSKKTSAEKKRKKMGRPKIKGIASTVSPTQISHSSIPAGKTSTPTGTTDCRAVEAELEFSNRLLKSISNAQAQYIAHPNSKQFFDDLLADALDLTQSEFGFIGKVLFTDQGKPYLKTHTLTNIAWNQETRELYQKHAATGMEFHNMDTLFGAVITTGQPVISNDPSQDPRSGGIPKGHPPLNSFLGLPFYHGGKLIGMVCMSNRPGGYTQELIEYLQPFLLTCANLLQAWDNALLQKQATQALHDSEERLNLVQEATTDGVWDWNISTGHVFFSPQWFRSLGYEPGELEPHVSSWEKLVHPADMPELRKPLNAHLEGKISFFQFENRLRAKSGKYRWYLGRGQVVSRDPSGKPLRMVGTDTDITERKQAEQALGKAIRDMQLILDSAGEGIYGLDLEGRVTFINPVAAHMLGFHLHDELIGKKCALFCTIPKPMALYPEEECSIHKSIKDGNIYHVTDGVFWKKDGTSFPVEYYCTPILEKDSLMGAVVTFKDITVQKQHEEELRQRNQQLKNLLAHLEYVREEERAHIAREVHDELGQILTTFKFDLSELEELIPPDSERIGNFVKSLIKNLDNILDSTQKILIKLRPQVLDIFGVGPAFEWQASEFQNQTGIACEVNHFPENLQIEKDKSLILFRILQEALINVKRHAKASRVQINFSLVSEDLIMEIKDNGVGMKPKNVNDPQSFGILGIQERADLLGGTASFRSNPGEGTTVSIRLPK